MKVLITGATGFIGSHVARAFVHAGDRVAALVRPASDRARLRDLAAELEFVPGDLNDLDGVRRTAAALRPELCVHLAWYAVPGKYPSALENLECAHATQELALALARGGCRRLVGVGSCAEYDTDLGYLSEASPLRPRNLYAATKAATQLTLEQLARRLPIEIAWARLFYQYGPHEPETRLVAAVIRSLLRGERARTTRGEQVRDYLHVTDVAAAVRAVALAGLCGVVNVGSGQPVSVAALVGTIARLMGRAELLELGALPTDPDEPRFVCANNRRLREQTPWAPRYDLEQGLRDTIAWWEGRHDP